MRSSDIPTLCRASGSVGKWWRYDPSTSHLERVFRNGLFDAVKGLFNGDGLSGVLESTGLSEHVEGLLGEGSAIAENVGIDLGQVTESLPGGLGDVADNALGGLTDVAP